MLLLGFALAGPRLNVASDVTPWLLDGYSLLLMVDAEPWRFGVEFWGMDMPAAMIELNPANAGKGWQRRVDLAVAVYADRHLFEDNAGWHVGLAADALRSTVTLDGGQASFWSVEVLARGGYRWFPFEERGLFLNPWAAVGPLVALDEVSVGGERFDELPYQLLATCHLGWQFR